MYTPPSHRETKKYMDELLDYMNDVHDGNGRVGRLLVSLYLFKAKVINFPFFYISEAISQDKAVYYSKLTDTRSNNYDEWIKFFLQKIIVQTNTAFPYV